MFLPYFERQNKTSTTWIYLLTNIYFFAKYFYLIRMKINMKSYIWHCHWTKNKI